MIELDLVCQDMHQDALFDELDVKFTKLEIPADVLDDQAVFDYQHFRFQAHKENVGDDVQQLDSVSVFLDVVNFLDLEGFGVTRVTLNLNKVKPKH
jgi:hypothetical protein